MTQENKNKVKQIFTYCQLFLIANCFAQNADLTLKWGPKNDNGLDISYSLFGSTTSGLYMISQPDHYGWQKSHDWISKFTNNTELTFHKELIVPACQGVKSSELYVEDVMLLHNKVLLFTSQYDDPTFTNRIYVNTITPDGVVSNDCVTVLEAKGENDDPGVPIIRINDDSSMIGIVSSYYNKVRHKQIILMSVLDLNLKPIWNKNIDLPFDKPCDIQTFSVDKNGDLVLGVEVQLHDVQVESKDLRREALLTYNWKSSQLKEYDIESEGNYMFSLYFLNDEQNAGFKVAGIYKTKADDVIAGCFYFFVDKNSGGISHKTMKPFDASFNKNYDKTQGFFNFYDIHYSPNGNLILIAEQSYAADMNGATSSTNYHNGNIFVFSFAPDGSLSWNKTIRKNQIFTEFSHGGYCYIPNGNDVYLIYNDTPKNHGLHDVTDNSAVVANYFKTGESEIVVVKITSDGNVSKSYLSQPDADKPIAITPTSLYKLSDKLFAVRGNYFPSMNTIDKYRIGTFQLP